MNFINALIQALQRINFLRFITAFTVMGVFFLITNALIFRTIPQENKEILIHLLGIVEGAVMTIVGYEFGSARNDKKKENNEATTQQ
jgi:uncharacterized membrane protein